MASEQSALRPLTLPSLPPDVAHLSDLKFQLAQTQQAIEGYTGLRTRLETFTDEPTWNAYVGQLRLTVPAAVLTFFLVLQIPFGPLAYFPGQLVHTNDIVQSIGPEGAASHSAEGGKAEGKEMGNGARVLRSAKQAREEAERLQKGASSVSSSQSARLR